MAKSFSLWIVAIALIGYGLYSMWAALQSQQYLYLIYPVLCFIGSIGLLLAKPWSRFFVYLISFLVVAGWIYIIAMIAINGWPYETIGQSIISLIPGIFFISVFIYSSISVGMYFGKSKTKS